MAGKVRNLVERDGRYYARIVIPKPLRPYIDCKTELRAPLGADRRLAMQNHPREVAVLLDRLEIARRALARQNGLEADSVVRAGAPMSSEQIARDHYRGRLAFDDELRNFSGYAESSIDDLFVAGLRRAIAGAATDAELHEMLGRAFHRYQRRGSITVAPATIEGRRIMRALAVAEYEALSRVAERDEGDFSGEAADASLAAVDPQPEPVKVAVSIQGLFHGYLAELEKSQKGVAARKRWTPVFAHLSEFVGGDDANLVNEDNASAWLEELLLVKKLAPKTVKDVYVAAAKAVFKWAKLRRRISHYPLAELSIKAPKMPQSRSNGFEDDEAITVLRAVSAYKAKHSDNPQTREAVETTAAKRWIPWLCAHTGSRPREMGQLRREDVKHKDGIAFIRIAPDAGSVKNGMFRDVPIHAQLIEMGFLDFVEASADRALFYKPGPRRVDPSLAGEQVAGKVSEWLRKLKVIPIGVRPNYGWRHRFKTLSRDLGIDPSVYDALQGHSAKSASDLYGDVSMRARKAAIDLYPPYILGES